MSAKRELVQITSTAVNGFDRIVASLRGAGIEVTIDRMPDLWHQRAMVAEADAERASVVVAKFATKKKVNRGWK